MLSFMKTAISVQNNLFQRADEYAKQKQVEEGLRLVLSYESF